MIHGDFRVLGSIVEEDRAAPNVQRLTLAAQGRSLRGSISDGRMENIRLRGGGLPWRRLCTQAAVGAMDDQNFSARS